MGSTGMEDPIYRMKIEMLLRKEIILRLYKEILFSATVCQQEGWDAMEFLEELQSVINHFKVGKEHHKGIRIGEYLEKVEGMGSKEESSPESGSQG